MGGKSMKCPKCNSEINGNKKFCTQCGYNLENFIKEEKAKKKGESTNDGWAKDENGIRIDLSSDEALWNFLENNFSSLKKNCSAINN